MKKIIQSVFDKYEDDFHTGGKFEKWYPMYEAFQTFFLSSKLKSNSTVHVRDGLDTKRYMSIVLFALTPCALFGIYNTGYQTQVSSGLSTDLISILISGLWTVLPLIIVSYGVGLTIEFISCMLRGHEVNEGFLVTGLLYPLTLPPTIPLWQAAVGIAFGVIIGKEVFGGSGRNFLNPALTARAFVFFTYPAQLSGEVWTKLSVAKDQLIDGYSGATALAVSAAVPAGESVVDTLVSKGFTLSNLFWGLVPGSIGETSVACVLIGATLLIVTKVGSWRIMAGSLIGMVSMSLIFSFFATDTMSPFLYMPPVWQLCMGSFAFATVFMATDPVSAPSLETSKWIYGFLVGSVGLIIRTANPAYPEGWMLSILLMNVFAPLIDHMVMQQQLKKRIPNVI